MLAMPRSQERAFQTWYILPFNTENATNYALKPIHSRGGGSPSPISASLLQKESKHATSCHASSTSNDVLGPADIDSLASRRADRLRGASGETAEGGSVSNRGGRSVAWKGLVAGVAARRKSPGGAATRSRCDGVAARRAASTSRDVTDEGAVRDVVDGDGGCGLFAKSAQH
jgi:hypothetical protein